MAAKTKEQGGSIGTQQEHTTIAKEMEEGHVGEHNGEMDAQRRHPTHGKETECISRGNREKQMEKIMATEGDRKNRWVGNGGAGVR